MTSGSSRSDTHCVLDERAAASSVGGGGGYIFAAAESNRGPLVSRAVWRPIEPRDPCEECELTDSCEGRRDSTSSRTCLLSDGSSASHSKLFGANAEAVDENLGIVESSFVGGEVCFE